MDFERKCESRWFSDTYTDAEHDALQDEGHSARSVLEDVHCKTKAKQCLTAVCFSAMSIPWLMTSRALAKDRPTYLGHPTVVGVVVDSTRPPPTLHKFPNLADLLIVLLLLSRGLNADTAPLLLKTGELAGSSRFAKAHGTPPFVVARNWGRQEVRFHTKKTSLCLAPGRQYIY